MAVGTERLEVRGVMVAMVSVYMVDIKLGRMNRNKSTEGTVALLIPTVSKICSASPAVGWPATIGANCAISFLTTTFNRFGLTFYAKRTGYKFR